MSHPKATAKQMNKVHLCSWHCLLTTSMIKPRRWLRSAVPGCRSHDNCRSRLWVRVHRHQVSEYCSTEGGPVVVM